MTTTLQKPVNNFNVTVDQIVKSLRRRQIEIWQSKLPVGLHSDPKCGNHKFCGVGLIDWGSGNDPKPFFDVYTGADYKHYRKVNAMVKAACEEIGVSFMDMT
jgi:hypothetical protein